MEANEKSPLIETTNRKEYKSDKNVFENGDIRHKPLKPVNDAETSIETTVESNVKSDEDFAFFKAPRSKKILLLTLGIVNFCAMACFSLLSPFFPKEAKQKNVSETVIGLIFGSFEFMIFITAPIFGSYMTKIGSKFMFLSGVGVCGVCTILFGFLDNIADESTFASFCFLTRCIEALGASAYITASFAIISHAYAKYVSTVIGILETFSGVGMMLGPAVGSVLYTAGGYGLPFYVMGGLLIVCGVVCYIVMPPIEDKKRTLSRSIFYLLKSPLCLVVCFITMCGTCGFAFLDPVYADRLDQINLSTVLIGVMFLILSAVYALGAPIWGWIGDTKGAVKSLIIFGNFTTGLSYMMIAPSPFLVFYPFEVWSQIVALVLMGLFSAAAIVPTYNVLFEGAVKQLGLEDTFETHALVSGLYNSCWSLGAFIGPMTAGALVEQFEFPWACTACGGLFVIAGITMVTYVLLERYTTVCASRQSKFGDENITSSVASEKI